MTLDTADTILLLIRHCRGFDRQIADKEGVRLVSEDASVMGEAARVANGVQEVLPVLTDEERERQGRLLEIEIAEREYALECRKRDYNGELVIRVQTQKLGIAEKFMSLMTQADPCWREDSREVLQAQDLIKSAIINPRLKITQGDDGDLRSENASLTINEVATSMQARLTPEEAKQAGIFTVKRYREKYNRAPGKHRECIGGRVIYVNSYTERDRDIIEEAVHEVMETRKCGGSRTTRYFASHS